MTDNVEEVKPSLSKMLILAREAKGLSQQDVAEKLNFSVEKIAKTESIDETEAKLTPFERGYLRNYANLVEVDLTSFSSVFPEEPEVVSDIQLVQRFNYETTKPFTSRSWVKIMIYIVLAGLVFWLVSSVGLDFYDEAMSLATEEGSILSLPIPE